MLSDQKKTKNERKYYTEFLNVKALSSMHPEIKKLKTKNTNHAAHGNKNWRSSFVLMDYLTNDPPKSGEKILDIGCGWGLVSIFLSKNFNNEVHSIDIDPSVVPFFSLQTSINKTDTSIKIKNFTEYTKTTTHALRSCSRPATKCWKNWVYKTIQCWPWLKSWSA